MTVPLLLKRQRGSIQQPGFHHATAQPSRHRAHQDDHLFTRPIGLAIMPVLFLMLVDHCYYGSQV
jgi:hypothetical protein